jgi:hypothetical protein
VSVTLDGAFVGSWGFNAPVVDGATGVLAQAGTTSVDSFRLRTNDPAFAAESSSLVTDTTGTSTAASLSEASLVAAADAAAEDWRATREHEGTALDSLRFAVADLAGTMLGLARDDVIYVDVDAAGHGWLTDPAAAEGSAGIDLRAVVEHELGHAIGLVHEDAEEFPVMGAVLASGRDLGTASDPLNESPVQRWAPDAGREDAGGSWLERPASSVRPSIDWREPAAAGVGDLWSFDRNKTARAGHLVEFTLGLGSRASEEGDGESVEVVIAVEAEPSVGKNLHRFVKIDWDV